MEPGRTTYRATMLTGKGGLEALAIQELPLVEPGAGELRVRVRATGAGFTDVIMRRGYYPYAPKIPFVPGYEVAGEVDAIGPGVTGFRRGQRVAALTVHGGYGEYLVREAAHFIPIPDGVSDAQAAAAILNYVTAYQMIHRVAKVQAGQTVLVTGAAGGVGTALLQLLRLVGARVYGAASAGKHDTVRGLGATPIDYRGGRLDELVRAQVPGGVDVAFDGIGGANVGQCTGALRRGGLLVGFGFTGGALQGAVLAPLRGMLSLFVLAPLRGRRSTFYGITQIYRKDPVPFREDLPRVFELIAEGRIAPLIARRLPLLEARQANRLLEEGGVEGKIVLEAPAAAEAATWTGAGGR